MNKKRIFALAVFVAAMFFVFTIILVFVTVQMNNRIDELSDEKEGLRKELSDERAYNDGCHKKLSDAHSKITELIWENAYKDFFISASSKYFKSQDAKILKDIDYSKLRTDGEYGHRFETKDGFYMLTLDGFLLKKSEYHLKKDKIMKKRIEDAKKGAINLKKFIASEEFDKLHNDEKEHYKNALSYIESIR